jgi:hypothetical protein
VRHNRDQRQREVRARTESIRGVTMRDLGVGAAAYPEQPGIDYQRPRTRGECPTVRPCPFVSCRHHLFIDVDARNGSIKFNFPDLEPHELAHSCSLDVAERGGVRVEDVGALINVTRERARVIETVALARAASNRELEEHVEGPRQAVRRLPLVGKGRAA